MKVTIWPPSLVILVSDRIAIRVLKFCVFRVYSYRARLTLVLRTLERGCPRASLVSLIYIYVIVHLPSSAVAFIISIGLVSRLPGKGVQIHVVHGEATRQGRPFDIVRDFVSDLYSTVQSSTVRCICTVYTI